MRSFGGAKNFSPYSNIFGLPAMHKKDFIKNRLLLKNKLNRSETRKNDNFV